MKVNQFMVEIVKPLSKKELDIFLTLLTRLQHTTENEMIYRTAKSLFLQTTTIRFSSEDYLPIIDID